MGNSTQSWDTSDEKRHIGKYRYDQLVKYVAVMRKRVHWGEIISKTVFVEAERRLRLLEKRLDLPKD